MSNFNGGYEPFNKIEGDIKTCQTPCCINPKTLLITKNNNKNSFLSFKYTSICELYISIYINLTEIEHISTNLTTEIKLQKQSSFEKHLICSKKDNFNFKINIPLSIQELDQIFIPKTPPNKIIRYKLLIRLEPIDYKNRFTNQYYFNFNLKKEITVNLIKHKIEIKNKSFLIYDIYGIEDFKDNEQDSKALKQICNICLDEIISVLILPCRHMSLCLNCANMYNEVNEETGEFKLTKECPVCREKIKCFIHVKGLEEIKLEELA